MTFRALVPWAPVAAWMTVIFVLSSGPAPAAAGRIPDWATHGGGYAVLGLLAARALDATAPGGPGAHAAAALALSTVYGIADELHQSTVPSRTADPWDVVKDAAGAAVGALAWRGATRRRAAAAGPR